MKLTYDYLKSKGSHAKLILGGWGGGHQLPSLLKGWTELAQRYYFQLSQSGSGEKSTTWSFWERLPGTVMYGQFPGWKAITSCGIFSQGSI